MKENKIKERNVSYHTSVSNGALKLLIIIIITTRYVAPHKMATCRRFAAPL